MRFRRVVYPDDAAASYSEAMRVGLTDFDRFGGVAIPKMQDCQSHDAHSAN